MTDETRPDAMRDHVVITGASRGIGAALTELYARRGVPVVAAARRFEGGVAPGVIRVEADVATPEGIAAIRAAVEATGARIGALINNAGIQRAVDLTVAPEPEGIAQEIAVNLTAPILLTTALLSWLRQPGGTVVNVTSLVSRHPKPSAPVYSASKAGLASFTGALRHQLAPVGIRVAEVLPPLVDTAMTAGRGRGKLTAEEAARSIADGIAAGRAVIAPGMAARVLMLNRVVPGVVARIMARN